MRPASHIPEALMITAGVSRTFKRFESSTLRM